MKPLILTCSVSKEFSPQRDVSSPTDWMDTDKTCSDCGRESQSYNSVSISVSTENLEVIKPKGTRMVKGIMSR